MGAPRFTESFLRGVKGYLIQDIKKAASRIVDADDVNVDAAIDGIVDLLANHQRVKRSLPDEAKPKRGRPRKSSAAKPPEIESAELAEEPPDEEAGGKVAASQTATEETLKKRIYVAIENIPEEKRNAIIREATGMKFITLTAALSRDRRRVSSAT